MRVIGFILSGCIALAVLKAAIGLIVIVVGAMVVWFGVTRPREMLALIAMLAAYAAIASYPFLGLAILGGLTLARLMTKYASEN